MRRDGYRNSTISAARRNVHRFTQGMSAAESSITNTVADELLVMINKAADYAWNSCRENPITDGTKTDERGKDT